MNKNDERLMTVRELAQYMQTSERTILRMASTNVIPGARIGTEWRFKRDVIDKWLLEQMDSNIDDDGQASLGYEPNGSGVPLAELLEERCIVPDLAAKDKIGAIELLAARAFQNGWLIDKPWFVGLVVEREALASTAMEGGVAFLHTRQRHAEKIKRPFVIMGRSYSGLSFGAPDGRPTYLFFLLGLKHDRLHLPILGRLARILKRPEVVRTLRASPSIAHMRNTLLQEDARAVPIPAPDKTKKSHTGHTGHTGKKAGS